MIPINELRFWNWVYATDNSKKQIDCEALKYLSNYPNNNQLTPIPLTEDILLKCGFKNDVWKTLDLPVLCEGQIVTMSMCKGGGSEGYILLLNGYSEQGMDCFDIAETFADMKREDYPNGIGINNKENCIAMRPLTSLHQLQNIFYFLTGQELEIQL